MPSDASGSLIRPIALTCQLVVPADGAPDHIGVLRLRSEVDELAQNIRDPLRVREAHVATQEADLPGSAAGVVPDPSARAPARSLTRDSDRPAHCPVSSTAPGGDARVEIELDAQTISPSPGQRLQDVRPSAVVIWLAGEELAWKSRVRDRQPNPVEAGARDPRKVFLGLQRSPEADNTCDGR